MSWLDKVLGRPTEAKSPITFPSPPKVTQPVGRVLAIERQDGSFAVQFDSDCECVVTIHCVTWESALYLAATLQATSCGCDVDVGLDRL